LPVGADSTGLPQAISRSSFSVEIPSVEEAWNIGVIVGPSGSGKTTIAKKAFGDRLVDRWDWAADQSILDGFPHSLGIREITELLGSVGFSSPLAWLRPFQTLSNGEQFRVNLARTLAEIPDLAVVDEFTSVVDRTVARIGSAAIGRAVRKSNRRLVAVSCHYDILPWLEPDWILDMANLRLEWRDVERREEKDSSTFRRPTIELEIIRSDSSAWKLFGRYHYLNGRLHRSAQCFLGLIEGKPAAFVAVLPFPHPKRWGWREHRCVCLPDFQGVGIGNAMSEFVASLYVGTGRPYWSLTSHPAMIHHRARSRNWRMTRKPSRKRRTESAGFTRLNKTISMRRMTASFEYVGMARRMEAAGFGLKLEHG
jgi:hypothetical protein